MTADDSKLPRFTDEEKERRRARLQSAVEADAKLGPAASAWVDELPEAPPLDGYTTVIFVKGPLAAGENE